MDNIISLIKIGFVVMAAVSLASLALYLGLMVLVGAFYAIKALFNRSKIIFMAIMLLLLVISLTTLIAVTNGAFAHSGSVQQTKLGTKSIINDQVTTPVVTPQTRCNLDEAAFINNVNNMRKNLGLKYLSQDLSLDKVATIRIQDMLINHYYGHTNPVTKLDVWPLIRQDTNFRGGYGEVLDGPLDASSAYNDFINSPEHYSILTSTATSIGAASAFQSDIARVYDDKGNPTQSTGNNSCIVVADLAL